MPRPRNLRCVRGNPKTTYFKPAGVKMSELEEEVLTVEEYEAIRHKDYDGADQGKAAEMMEVSQPTFHRILLSAREKIAKAIVEGKAIKIEGGNYKFKVERCGKKQYRERKALVQGKKQGKGKVIGQRNMQGMGIGKTQGMGKGRRQN